MTLPTDPRCGPEGSAEGIRLAKYWLGQIKKADNLQARYVKRGRAIERRYRDERNRSEEEGQRRANYLWANTQQILPALYGKVPLPIAERRFGDKDPVGRAAAQIIERALRNDMESDQFNDSVSCAVLDYLLAGRGVCWVRYEPQFEQGTSIPAYGQSDVADEQGDIEDTEDEETPSDEHLEDTGDRLLKESCPIDYIQWEDIYFFPAKARTWAEVRAIGKRLYMSKDELKEWFGSSIGKGIPLQRDDKARREGKNPDDIFDDKGHVYEIWDKDNREVIWVADGYQFLAGVIEDPLELEHFWPIPKPLIANSTNTSMIPIPFYIQYQDQARHIDELTQRISQNVKATKVAGVYNATMESIARVLDESVENELIPEMKWSRFMEGNGGFGGNISLFPIETVAKTLEVLVPAKEAAIREMDRLTGITDILRGASSPDGRETLGGQRLKNTAGKSRLRDQQDDVAEFCRGIVRIKAEIMAKHFSSRALIDMSGALYEEGLGAGDVMALKAGYVSDQVPAVPQALPAPATSPTGLPSASPGGGSNIVPMPGVEQPQPAELKLLAALQRISAAIRLLRDDYARGFRIDIEVDSTLVMDEEADKEARNEFIKSITVFLGEAGKLAMANPAIVPLLGKLLQFTVRGYRVGRDLEMAIEEFCEQAEQQAKAAASQPKPPSPEQVKAHAEQVKGQNALVQQQLDTKARLAEIAAEDRSNQADIQKTAMEIEMEKMRGEIEQLKALIDLKKIQADSMRPIHAAI